MPPLCHTIIKGESASSLSTINLASSVKTHLSFQRSTYCIDLYLFILPSFYNIDMARKKISPAERLAAAIARGYTVQDTESLDESSNQVEQHSITPATQDKHRDVADIWEEYVNIQFEV